jgi:hypothetical protein
MSSNNNFKKVFQEEFELNMVQVARSMFDKYYTQAYTSSHVHLVEDMILTSTRGCSDEKLREMRVMCWKKTSWMAQMKVIRREVVDKVSKRKCDCNKLWYECRNTCIKPKTNPTPIELPQDVFNVIKDYLGVIDIPEPITELMGMIKQPNMDVWYKMHKKNVGEVPIKTNKSLCFDERVRLYNSCVIRQRLHNKYLCDAQKGFLLKLANKYPQLRFGKELTDMNKIYLMDLIFHHSYVGIEDQGLKADASLFDFMRGECGLAKFKRTPKNPKPYVMYFERDYCGEEYSVRNFPYDMRDFYKSMDRDDFRQMMFVVNHTIM